MNTKEIETKIKKLPDYIIPEVMDYIDNLLNKYSKTTIKKGRLNSIGTVD